MNPMQEKFEVRFPPRKPRDHEWATDKSARDKKGAPVGNAMLNTLPPGEDIEAQALGDFPAMPFSMGGEDDVSKDWNRGAVKKGYTRKKMLPTDDMYTNEHNDAFYDSITVDGDEGFIERNNMLDRA